MKKIVSFILFLSLSFALFSQATVSQGVGRYVPVYTNNNYVTNLPKQKTPPKGSVYLTDDYMNATIVLRDSSYITNVKANYNFYSKKLEIDDNTQVLLLNLSKIDWFILSDGTNKYFYESGVNFMLDYPHLGISELVHVLEKGSKVTLIDKLSLDLIPANYVTAIDAGSTSDTYVLKHEYYLIKDGELFKVRKTKGYFLNVFSDKKAELKQYIKAQNLKMRQPEDMAKLVNFYNTLHEQPTN